MKLCCVVLCCAVQIELYICREIYRVEKVSVDVVNTHPFGKDHILRTFQAHEMWTPLIMAGNIRVHKGQKG